MKITSMRLEIRPLNSDMLELYAVYPQRLSEALELEEILHPLDEHMKKVYQLKSNRIKNEPNTLLFHTYYLIIENIKGQPRQVVGFIGLKGEPDSEGTVEVGYHIFSVHRNKGYMKEALSTFSNWLLQFKEIACIQACTSKENLASQHVLAACNYEIISKHRDMIVWSFTAI